ncbi:hypothetical protein CRM22_005730 [Opisthorchis felineus]|uniref:Ribosomal protein S36 n=1 Tax=Opisthorchis felineus TaxID=147828 RepID=A0A4S2LPQ8_OPIFE|nr:hypothetical protein CRM22_005730 [Opisthorchis felineus]
MPPARATIVMFNVVRKHVPLIKFRSQLKRSPATQTPTSSQQPSSTNVVKCSIPPEQAVEYSELLPKFKRRPLTEEEITLLQTGGLSD